jgi:glycosyltransferase involved in cell wall biosynthesis
MWIDGFIESDACSFWHQETGILVTRNSRKIAKAIMKLLNAPELCVDISRNARKNVERLDWEILSDRIIENVLAKTEIP